jgi:hypothetical protein
MTSFQPTPDMIRAAENVFTAQALHDTVESIVRSYQRRILAEGQWPVASKLRDAGIRETIDAPEKDWLLGEDDFQTYLTRCEAERINAGLRVSKEGNCPLLEAESALRQAQYALIAVMAPVTKVTEADARMFPTELRDKVVDLSLRFLAPYVRDGKAIIEALVGNSGPSQTEVHHA